MVKLNIQNKSYATNARPPGPQTTSTSVGESPDSLNLISRASSRAGKCVHPRGCSRARRTVRCSSRSVSAAEDSRKASPEPSFSSEEEESEEEEVSPGPRTPTTSRIIIGKLSHRIAPLQLPATPSPSAPEGKTHSMSWDDQVSAEESKGLVSGVICAPQAPLSTSLMPHGPNHGTAKSSSLVEGGSAVAGTCDVTGDCNTLVICDCDSLPQASQQVTSDVVTYDCDLWDGEHHVTSLSGHFGYLENDTKVLASSVLHIAHFIQKHPIESHPIEQFPPILEVGSIIWHLFQTVSAARWNHFKVSPQPDSPSLVEAIRTLYGPNLPQEPSLDTEMAVDQPAVEKAPFTTVTNKKNKGKGKVPFSTNPSAPSQNMPTPAPVVSRAPPPPPPAKTAITKPTPVKVATKP